MPGRNQTLADRQCGKCTGWYPPTSPTQKYCTMCIPIADAERDRKFAATTKRENRKSLGKGVCHEGDANTPPPADVLARVEAWRLGIAYETARRACAISTPSNKPAIMEDLLTEWGSRPFAEERNPSFTCGVCCRKVAACRCADRGRG